MANGTKQPGSIDSPRIPLIQRLQAISDKVGAVGAIALLITILSQPSYGDTVYAQVDSQDDQIAGGGVTNAADLQGGESTESLQETISKLASFLPTASESSSNELVREEILDAIVGLSNLESEPSLIEEAKAALAQGDTKRAQALYKTDAENSLAVDKAKLQEAAQSYRRLGALALLDDIKAAVQAYEEAVDAWPKGIHSWNQLGHLYQRAGQLDSAIKAYTIVSQLADSTTNPQAWTAISLGNLGNVYQVRGDLDKAVALYKGAVALNQKVDNKQGLANNYVSLGIIHHMRDEEHKANRSWSRSIDLYNNIISPNYERLKRTRRLFGESSTTEGIVEETDLSLSILLDSKKGMARGYSEMGDLHRIRSELDQALQSYEKALVLNTDLGSKEGMATSYDNLGDVYRRSRKPDKAEAMYKEALAINRELGHKESMAINYGNLGFVYYTRGELGHARKFWRQSIELYDYISLLGTDKERSIDRL